MQYRLLKALALAVFACAIVAGPASAAPSWAPASSATIHPGVQTFTDWCPVHRQLRLLRRVERLPRPGRPLLGHRHGDRDQRLRQRLAAARHRGRHRRQQARHPRLQLVADDAVQGRDRTPTPARSTTSRWSRSIRPTSAASTRRSRSGAARPASTAAARPPATPSSATATPSCAAASPSSAPSRARASATTATAGATRSTRSRPASPATPARPSSTPAARRSASSARWPSRRWPAATASATSPRSSPTRTAPAASASRWPTAPRPSRARCSRSSNVPRSERSRARTRHTGRPATAAPSSLWSALRLRRCAAQRKRHHRGEGVSGGRGARGAATALVPELLRIRPGNRTQSGAVRAEDDRRAAAPGHTPFPR